MVANYIQTTTDSIHAFNSNMLNFQEAEEEKQRIHESRSQKTKT